MPFILQITLVALCLALLFLIVKQIAGARVVFSDFNYWIVFIFILLIMALFPQGVSYLSQLLQIETNIVTVFLIVIFLLILLLLSASFRISLLNRRFIQLTQKIALLEHELESRVEKLEEESKKTK